jgi:hypothetical protein
MSFVKWYVGVDNGVTGTVGFIASSKHSTSRFIKIPVFSQQNYTKKKQNITRVDHRALRSAFVDVSIVMLGLERPMVNPGRFQATTSAVRALESVLVILEELCIPYEYLDSKEWQKELLPKGIKGTPELKKASVDIGCRLFPEHTGEIKKHGDADGLLIAEYIRRKYGDKNK